MADMPTKYKIFSASPGGLQEVRAAFRDVIGDHFVDVNKMVGIGSGSQQQKKFGLRQALAAFTCRGAMVLPSDRRRHAVAVEL